MIEAGSKLDAADDVINDTKKDLAPLIDINLIIAENWKTKHRPS